MSAPDPFDPPPPGGPQADDPLPGGDPASGGPSGEPDAQTPFRVEIEVPRLPGVVVPAVALMLEEHRGRGWTGIVQVNPRIASAEEAFRTVLQDGLVPGGAILVKLVVSGTSVHADTAVRFWPSVITSVSTRRWYSGTSDNEAFCGVTFRDPLSHLRGRAIWSSYARCSLSEILGGVLSAATGGDGRPTREPALPGMPVVRIREQLRASIGEIPYAIAVGEPLGYWLDRVCGRLGVRIEMLGDGLGRLNVELRDGNPSEAGTGRGIRMTIDPSAEASAINLTIDEPEINSPHPLRGGLLDTPAGGGAKRFGRPGAVETVIVAARTEVTEAEKRSGFRRGNQSLSHVRVSAFSAQPGLLPGRVLQVTVPPRQQSDADADSNGQDPMFGSLFGADEWQVADLAHLFACGEYWNSVDLEKVGTGWRPDVPGDQGVVIVSGVVDDGASEDGQPVPRDRLGRIPVRFPFFIDDTSGTEPSPMAGDTLWPPSVPLAPVESVAGNLHGFVPAHRQGDWCRVAVVNPLYAEIVGFGYRDDRYLSARIRDATMGIVVQQGPEDWRGMLFRPHEDLDLDRELEDGGSQPDEDLDRELEDGGSQPDEDSA